MIEASTLNMQAALQEILLFISILALMVVGDIDPDEANVTSA